MTFEEVLNQARAMLQRQGRVSYRALKRQFGLDDEYLEDLKVEIIEVHQLAVDQDGTMLVWTGDAGATGLNLSHKLAFALLWGPLHKGGPPWRTSPCDPVPMPSFGTARRFRCQRWKRWNNG